MCPSLRTRTKPGLLKRHAKKPLLRKKPRYQRVLGQKDKATGTAMARLSWLKRKRKKTRNLLRLGYLTAVVITIHNIPEGLATFITALKDLRLGVTIAIAIAVHNIPEGISVSVPIYCATGSRRKAFIYSFLSGLTELVGALIGFFILMPFLSNVLFGVIFALTAGIMVFIALDELLPAAKEYGEHHLAIYGLVLGMLIMAVSLVFM